MFDDPKQMAAFSKFYTDSTPRLVAFLRCLGASYTVASDCVQETMFRALPPQWARLRNPHAWCRRVCRHLYTDVQRGREEPVADFAAAGTALLSSEEEFLRLEQQAEIVGLMRRLPRRQRLVMACRLDGAEFEEIAELMGVEVVTVRSTYRHAKKNLARYLAEDGDGR